MLRFVRELGKRFIPVPYYNLKYGYFYYRVMKDVGDAIQKRDKLFEDMITRSNGKPSLQFGVRGQKYAEHWISVDLFDTSPLIDFNYDIQDLPFEDESFEFVACLAVLEHVPDPTKAIAEMYRILKHGGEIWIEVPLNQPYHPSPQDYWRVTPDGMRIWMQDFDELSAGIFALHNSPIYNGVFFHGRKP